MHSLIWKHALSAAALSLVSLSAAAAPFGSDGLSLLAAAVVAQAEPDDDATFNLNFEGGTVADYTKALQRAVKANIVLIEPAGDIPLPPMNLSQVSFATAISLLDGFTQQMGHEQVSLKLSDSWDGNGLPIYTVHARLSSGLMQLPTASAVISVARILQSGAFSAEDCMGAIETALEVIAGDREPAQIRFHAATGLLIARGAPEQIDAIHEVVSQLMESAGAILEERGIMSPEEQEGLIHQRQQAMEHSELWKKRYEMQRDEKQDIRRQMENRMDDSHRVIEEREAQIFELQQEIRQLRDALQGVAENRPGE